MTDNSMRDCLAMLRMMNLYYHHLHNISNGKNFLSDHTLMAEFYEAADAAYDMLIERYIGLGNECSKGHLLQIITEAHRVLESIPEEDDMENHLYYAINLEMLLRAELESACEGASRGTVNLLEGLMDESEVRTYKLNQRVK